MLRGKFDSHGNACLNFMVHRLSDGTAVNLRGIIDTGFDGFIQIPLPVGVLAGVVGGSLTASKTRLADGKVIGAKRYPGAPPPPPLAGEAGSRAG